MKKLQSRYEKNKKTHKNEAEFSLDALSKKYQILKLTFADFKLINSNGEIYKISYDYIKANIKYGVMILKINGKEMLPEIYDLVTLMNSKKENEVEMNQDKFQNEESGQTMVQNNEESGKHMVQNKENEVEMNQDKFQNEESNHITHNGESDQNREIERTMVKEERNCNDNETKNGKTDPEPEGKRRNKYYRRILKDLKKKLEIKKELSYIYCETKVGTTFMVIENPEIYLLEKFDNRIIIFGDLLLKSSLIRKLDPKYEADKIYKEQREFLDRIQNNKSEKSDSEP